MSIKAMKQALNALRNTWVPDVQEVKAIDALREAIREYEVEREWVGLTDDEIAFIYCDPDSYASCHVFARAIEAKLKEKNT
jgi:ornithine carbamoyltransferase